MTRNFATSNTSLQTVLGDDADSYIRDSSRTFDAAMVESVLATIAAVYNTALANDQGNFVLANPRDIFYTDYILRHLPEARFIITLRDPVQNVWSSLNYPSGEWGARGPDGLFPRSDIEQTAKHWNKVADRVLEAGMLDDPRFIVIDQSAMMANPRPVFATMGEFLGIDDLPSHARKFEGTVNHSSFGASIAPLTHSTEIEAARKGREAFLKEPGFVEAVVAVCKPYLLKFAERGVLADCFSLNWCSEGA